MRIKPNFELRDICDQKVIIAQGIENIDFNQMIVLNESSTYLWEQIVGKSFTEADMVALLCDAYDIDEATAINDIKNFTQTLRDLNLLVDWGDVGTSYCLFNRVSKQLGKAIFYVVALCENIGVSLWALLQTLLKKKDEKEYDSFWFRRHVVG